MNEALEQLVRSWCEEFVSGIEASTGEKPSIESITPMVRLQPSVRDQWFEQRFSDRSSTFWIYVPERSQQDIAEHVPEMRLVNLISHASAEFSEQVMSEGERQVRALPAALGSAPTGETLGCMVEIGLKDTIYNLGLVLRPEMVDRLAKPARKGSILEEMDLVLDMELPVTVSIGTTKMPLKDVLKLTTGSIVELDRLISDPVDVLVSNCVVARGEVVVIEGNYGVRILEVVSRSERLALRGTGRRITSRQELAIKGA